MGTTLRPASVSPFIRATGNTGTIVVPSATTAIVSDQFVQIAGAGETGTLPIPNSEGDLLTLAARVVAAGGDITYSCAQALNQAGNTNAQFTAVGDYVTFRAVNVNGTLMWRDVGSNNITYS